MNESALRAWRSLLGPENLIVDENALECARTATFQTHQRVGAILRPASRAELQECLQIANRYEQPVKPISSGKNWGYGSRVPVSDGAALIDLGRLNRIVDFSEELAYVTVEPGVTQQQLYEFLKAQKSRLWMDATGSSPECSLIGNTVERGFGHTPYGDHFAQVCGLEVVLPTGECIHTGMGQFTGAHAAPVYRWGVGPALDGLFTQSNFGIVTQMTIWLMPAPEYFQAFYFSAEGEEDLALLIEALRPLRLDGTIKSAIHIGNSYKVLSSIRQYPWSEMDGATPLSPEVMANFARTWDFGAWNGSGGLYGTRGQVAEARRLVKRALKGKVRSLKFLDDRTLALAERFAVPYRLLTGLNLPEMLKIIKPVYHLMKGVPTSAPLASTYWRKRTAIPPQMHPDRDGCGLIWCAPVAPLTGAHANAMNQIISRVVTAHKLEPMISMTLLTERCLSCIATIAYDRSVPGEDQRALQCYEQLLKELTDSGYYPYRLGIQSQSLTADEASYRRLLNQLKTSLDPKQILAPGRYQASPLLPEHR